MPDFGGPVFAFEKARLIQPDWRDVNGDLIPPWLNHKLLRPGTLVVANMSIQVYVMISKSGDGMVRKVLPVFFVMLLGFDRTFDFV